MNTNESSPPVLELSWDKHTVPLEALERAMYALAQQLSGTISDAGDRWATEIYPRSPAGDLASLAHRIRQEVTDQALRLKVAEQGAAIRNLVFALAFSRTGLVAEDRGS